MAELRHIPLGEIDEPPLAIRLTMDDEKLDDLAQSIREIGLQQPITVVVSDNRYRIVTGHRRYIAHQKANLSEIMCLVRAPGEIQEIASMVHENILREDVNPAEEAIFYARLVDEQGYTEADLMSLTRRSSEYIADRFRLLRGDEQIFAALQRGDISFSTARELNKCGDEPMRRFYLDNAIRGGHASRVVRRWIKEWEQNQGYAQQTIAPQSTPPQEPAAEPEKFCCALCGGHRDPWNFMTVTVHKMEWELIEKQLSKPPEHGNGT